jgi:hypothetical protein
LKVRLSSNYPAEEAFELEEANSRLNFGSEMIMVEGHRVNSYEELIRLVSRDEYKNKEFLEVVGIMPIAGG